MKGLAPLTILILTVLAGFLSFAAPSRAQETAGGPGCPPADSTDFGYSDALPGPLGIPDESFAADCFDVFDTRTISDLDVAINITHTWVGDLKVVIRHEVTSTTVTLLDLPGVPASANGCSGDNVRATFTDESSDPAETQCNAAPPAVYGFLLPAQALSAFDGESISGAWAIEVFDAAGGDTGTLDSWTILPTYEVLGGNGDVNCSGDADAVDATLILQIAAGFNFTLQCAEEGDVNGNLQLDAIDATLVLQYAAGLIPFLPLPPPIL
jgi:hypothetical protein